MNVRSVPIAQLVHDLKNEVAAMTFCADAIADSIPTGSSEHLLEWRRCAGRVSMLARNLLNGPPHPGARLQIDVNRVIELTVATGFRSIPNGERMVVRVKLWPMPLVVVAEFAELERILLNLILNARESMPNGGLLAIETAIVDSSSAGRTAVSPPRPYARVTIEDSGNGMTPAVRARIFEAFFTTKDTGAGLGLCSVATTVQQLDGVISVTSEPGRGTSVTIMLPLAADPRD